MGALMPLFFKNAASKRPLKPPPKRWFYGAVLDAINCPSPPEKRPPIKVLSDSLEPYTVAVKIKNECYLYVATFELYSRDPMKDFFWELVMLIYVYLIYLNNLEISSFEILKVTSRFLIGRWF